MAEVARFIAVIYAAVFIWLIVRVVNRRERQATWALAGLIGGPIVFGIAFFLGMRLAPGPNP